MLVVCISDSDIVPRSSSVSSAGYVASDQGQLWEGLQVTRSPLHPQPEGLRWQWPLLNSFAASRRCDVKDKFISVIIFESITLIKPPALPEATDCKKLNESIVIPAP